MLLMRCSDAGALNGIALTGAWGCERAKLCSYPCTETGGERRTNSTQSTRDVGCDIVAQPDCSHAARHATEAHSALATLIDCTALRAYCLAEARSTQPRFRMQSYL